MFTNKITGVPSGGGIGRGLATVHAGLDGSRPVEQAGLGLVPTRIKSIGNITGKFEYTPKKKRIRKKCQTFSEGGKREGKKMK